MIREIIKIDEEKCDGCGICIPACPEGALQIIDSKARIVSDLMCDGLGACLGECPLGAISIEKREAHDYDETEVIKNIVFQGKNTTLAHLKHLLGHGQSHFYQEAIAFLRKNRAMIHFDIDELINLAQYSQPQPHMQTENINETSGTHPACNCPGAATMDFRGKEQVKKEEHSCNCQQPTSQLRQWPIQMHLVNPSAPYFKNCDLLLAADCVAFALADFHDRHLKGKSIAIACPKLDSHQEIYVNKLIRMIEDSNINTITVMIMEVPCCSGLLHTAISAVQSANRKIPVKMQKVSLRGEILAEESTNMNHYEFTKARNL